MAPSLQSLLTVAAALLLPLVSGQACTAITPTYGAPVMASGYTARIVMNGLKTPRGMIFDSAGNLLVSEQGGGGIRQVKLRDNGGADVCVASSKQLIADSALNHGIALSNDGKTLYVSTRDQVHSYPYDAAAGTVGTKKILLTSMTKTGGHQTHTLLVPKNAEDVLLVQRGSAGNIDTPTAQESTGRSMIKLYKPSAMTGNQPYSSSGTILGWGLRNSVGVGEHPTTGGIFSVENSVDDMQRTGRDIHNTNPAEEMNYHGIISNENAPERGKNYGYPTCFTIWDPAVVTDVAGAKTGLPFFMGTPGSGDNTDAFCQNSRVGPRLSFPSHTAPLDIKFNANGTAGYISFHGSWDRQPPDGYRVSRINFGADGQPTEPVNSNSAAINIMQNANVAQCGTSGRCFRPAGLAFDSKGRLFMSSDSTNEIYVIAGPL